ncbi:MAG: twin-arginine translocase subunit TatC [Cyclobacteriaceae bacterium]|nr:twin-arginine translocase subunit TatC [Cyclobacteriaceae bacterium]MCB0498704.1 twin-arginine translocase subunit TatC [Cyclobacteriaceae bacterium]MCB9237784.1 twin-arginine translocase subunit TatC [Flammeovirgaceae bacterium]MCO5270115.1 twin-arginine translocase subunit TatC [Cyclobacteriaceae bacterium]MCW5903145.1 twin-arginine translocase subunit TatC [Cyclobacteriaceae bacterium]
MNEEKEMSFLDHLEELRWHIVRSISAVFLFMVTVFVFGKWIFQNVIFAPARADFVTFRYMCKVGHLLNMADSFCVGAIPFKVQSRIMTGQFTMHLTVAFVLGFIIAFPYVFWEIWKFVTPGLHASERNNSRWAVTAVSFLFLVGVSFGYFIMSPLAVWFLSTYSVSDMVSNEFDITSYVSTITALVFGSGLLFQLPVVVYFLSRVGIVTPRLMKQYRKHALVAILILGAIITPPDPLSQILISLPLYMLYEVSILISSIVERKRLKKDKENLRADQAEI